MYTLCERAVKAFAGKQRLEETLHTILDEAGGSFSSRELELCGLFLQTALIHSAAANLQGEGSAFGRAVEGVREVSSLDVDELIDRYCPMEQTWPATRPAFTNA